jgi:hypothetical protein
VLGVAVISCLAALVAMPVAASAYPRTPATTIHTFALPVDVNVNVDPLDGDPGTATIPPDLSSAVASAVAGTISGQGSDPGAGSGSGGGRPPRPGRTQPPAPAAPSSAPSPSPTPSASPGATGTDADGSRLGSEAGAAVLTDAAGSPGAPGSSGEGASTRRGSPSASPTFYPRLARSGFEVSATAGLETIAVLLALTALFGLPLLLRVRRNR